MFAAPPGSASQMKGVWDPLPQPFGAVDQPCIILCLSLSFSFSIFCASERASRSRRQEVTQHDPEEHGDGAGGGDAQQDDSPGQPGVHRRQHEQLQLGGKVRRARRNEPMLMI